MKSVISPYLIAIIAAWLISQLAKSILSVIKTKNGKQFCRACLSSGGMPSVHSATAVSLSTVIGFRDGINSGLFGIAFLATIIIVYDALMVRRSSGEQWDAIVNIIDHVDKNIHKPFEAKGHKPFEAIVGCIIGFIIGFTVYILTKKL